MNMNEIPGAIRKIKSGKANGVDRVKAKNLKSVGKVSTKWIVGMLNICLSSGSVANE